MKILVLGATGRLIVGKAVAKGYEVVALVRSKAKATDLAGAELTEGDPRDPAALTSAIVGCDAVVSSLGTAMSPFKEVTLLSTATRTLEPPLGAFETSSGSPKERDRLMSQIMISPPVTGMTAPVM